MRVADLGRSRRAAARLSMRVAGMVEVIERLLDDRCEWLILAEVIERLLDDRCD